MDNREYTSARCLAPEFHSHFISDPEHSGWSFDPTPPAEPTVSTASRVSYTSCFLEPLPLVGDPAFLPQTLDPILPQSPSHTESMCSGSDWGFSTSEGDLLELGSFSSVSAQSLVPNPNHWFSEYDNDAIHSSSWVTGYSDYHTELLLPHFERTLGLSHDLSMRDMTDDAPCSQMFDNADWENSGYPYERTEEENDPTWLDRVLDTSTDGSASRDQPSNKSYFCPISECSSSGFLHHSDLCRHQRTVHMRQESGEGYRCAFEGCSKADKIWTRLDSFKQHVVKRHRNANVQEIVRQSARSGSGADAYFPFAVTTPSTMSRKRHK